VKVAFLSGECGLFLIFGWEGEVRGEGVLEASCGYDHPLIMRRRVCHPLIRTTILLGWFAALLIALPLWLCSWTNDMLWCRNDERGVAAILVRQGTIAWLRQPMPLPEDHYAWRHGGMEATAPGLHWGRFRFRVLPEGTAVEVPAWFPAALGAGAAVPGLVWLRRRDTALKLASRSAV